MIEWEDEGVVLRVTPYGEGSAIVVLVTQMHGKHAGLVRAAKTSAMRSLLQSGNKVKAAWKARLNEHLGTFKLEMFSSVASELFDDPLKIIGLTAAASIAEQALPDREPVPQIYEGLLVLLETMVAHDEKVWLAAYIRWEIGFLSESGFKLSLDRCVATGAFNDLAFVSPKSGCAVSASAGYAYREKLLPLPGFLTSEGYQAPLEFIQGLKLTEYFLSRHIFGVYNKPIPSARERLYERVATIFG